MAAGIMLIFYVLYQFGCCGTAALLGVLFVIKAYVRYTMGFCKSSKRLDGKTVIVTGANTGIGFETAKDLAQRRARVILACRDLTKANEARDEIINYTGNKDVIVKKLDLASLNSVREFAEDINATEERLDILVNNAGAIWLGNTKTADGLDMCMQVNHFGPFLLTNLLVDLIKKTGPGRIVFVSSVAHRNPYVNVNDMNFERHFSNVKAYSSSKLANVLNSNELARRLKGTGITVNSLHPGWVHTDVIRMIPKSVIDVIHRMTSIFMKTSLEGAQTTIYLAVSEEVEGVTGKYYVDCKESAPAPYAQDEVLARKIWALSETLTSV